MGLSVRIRNSFVAGLLLLAPLAVTVFVVQFAFRRLTTVLDPVVDAARLTTYTANNQIVAQLLAATLIAVAIVVLGFVASWGLGQRLFGGFERGVRLVPLVRTVYFGVRQVSESLTDRTSGYDRVVLVEYPRDGVYSLGFVTNGGPRATERATDKSLSTVFVPN
ncbi:MAG: DUF502 domain-containing protein, partial [Halobacteriota archaeon]